MDILRRSSSEASASVGLRLITPFTADSGSRTVSWTPFTNARRNARTALGLLFAKSGLTMIALP